MKINSLHLKNFGIIADEKVDLEKGIYLFYSVDNGEGKSTFLKALSLVLFNKVPGKISDYIRWGERESYVECSFSHKGKDYITSIEFSSKKNERHLKCLNSGDEWFTNSSVTDELDDILDIKRAIASVSSFEHEIDLITTSPSERREYLKKIYDLNFQEQISSIENEISNFENKSLKISTEIDSLENRSFDLHIMERPPVSSEKIEELKEELKKDSLDLSDLKLKMSQKRIELNKKIEEISKLDELKSLLESKKKSLEENNRSILDTKENISLEEETSFETTNAEFDFRIEKQKNNVKDLEKEIEETSIKLNNIPKEIENLQYKETEFESVTENYWSIKSQLESSTKRSQSIRDGVCPVCGSSFDSHDFGQFEKEIKDLTFMLGSVEENLNSITERKKAYEKIIKEKEQLENFLKSFEKNIVSAKEELSYLKKEKVKRKEDFEKTKSKRLEDLLESKSLKEEKKKFLELEIENLEDKLNSFVNSEIEIKKDEEYLNDLEIKRNEKEEVIHDKEEIVNKYYEVLSINEKLKEINDKLKKEEKENYDKIQKLKIEFVECEQMKETAKLSKKILSKDFPSYILSSLIQEVKHFANEFLQDVYPKYRLNFIEAKNSLQVVYGPNDTDVKLASGFEKQIFSFAYKYAIGKLQEYGILILDEVDSAASEENSEKFFETLALMKDYFPQILVITHKRNTVELLEKDHSAKVFTIKKGRIV